MKKTIKKPTIERLPSGSYHTRIMIGGKRASITGESPKDVTAQYYAIMAAGQIAKHQSSKPEQMTLGECVDAYIDRRSAVCSPSTIRGYRTVRYSAFTGFSDRVISTLSDYDFQAAINAECRQKSGKTVTNEWSVFSAALKEICDRTVRVQLPPVVRHEHEFLTAEQIPVFVSAVRGRSVEIPALLGLHSLRRSEIIDLTWQDIDLEKRIIHVRGSAVYNSEQELIHKDTNKTSNSRRDIPIMIPRLYDVLHEAQKDSGYVVTVKPGTIAKGVDRVCEKAGLPLIGCHGLRHSFASLALHVGLSPDVAMRLGGWDDLQTMKKIYTHVSEADLASAARAMSDFYN